ncbi:MAG: AAA family ATPase [Blautia sp.]|nr:AAA family ATPase [Lachnoclostridium sp.]MCM1212352.1 AAA family ATPase [Blautia sp.]
MIGIKPQGKQNEVLALPAKGHTVVLGTAGSGKTTIALLRAAHLSNLPGDENVLLVTFNGALVKYMQGICNMHSPKLTVENYHKFARGYLGSRGKMPVRNSILGPERKMQYIQQSVDYFARLYPSESTLKRSINFFEEEIEFIEKFGFLDFNDYYKAERIGRASANIKRENRKWIYDVYDKYMEFRKADGYKYDWDDLAFYVYNELKNDSTKRRYSHIIVDEGQDFSPMMLKSLVNAVGEGGSFTFFGDVAQQIYGSRLSWRDSGICVDRIWKFEVNYRNPSTIIAFASDIMKSHYWKQDSDTIKPTLQIAEGPKPILVRFQSKQNELEWVIRRAITIGKGSSTVIICRNREIVNLFKEELKKQGCLATEINKETPGYAHVKTVYLTTFHAAKGLEFDNVFIPFLTEGIFPDKETIEGAESAGEAYADEIKLLYVAVTRSKYGLYMSYHEELSMLFPVKSKNYDYNMGD